MSSAHLCTPTSDQDQRVRRYHKVCTSRYRGHRGYGPQLSGAHLARDGSWGYSAGAQRRDVGGVGCYRQRWSSHDGGDAHDGVLLPDGVSAVRRHHGGDARDGVLLPVGVSGARRHHGGDARDGVSGTRRHHGCDARDGALLPDGASGTRRRLRRGDARDGALLPDGVNGTRRAVDYVMDGSAHRVLRVCATVNPGLS